ncbi:SOS response-associated peptidase [Gelidibacter maritimus]|uniref:Abasic site processing protein n=1 Tax=Gelidibacter maritimus TaxID=2761487 RepID=A0A7W2M2C7_9FLAO|nr:SOS response-associated peptidase [Gelidibacter maritimus]MBA6151410.1 SOS response-associated peptidase [Gelidibacter maritimus]
MCYDIKTSVASQLKRAERKGDKNAIDEIMERLVPLTDLPLYHAMGFDHPDLLIYTNRSPEFPEVATWGLIPHWVRDEAQVKKIWNSTLNARGETIFEKNSFRTAAKQSRCLIYVDGFYEHHHFNKKTYPFFIHRKDKEPMILAGLYNEWHNPGTGGKLLSFSIVTTTGNAMMGKIHNNPKLEGPRMPVILPDELADKWLVDYNDALDQQSIEELIKEYPATELTAFTVNKLRGKHSTGNTEEASQPHNYAELPTLQL